MGTDEVVIKVEFINFYRFYIAAMFDIIDTVKTKYKSRKSLFSYLSGSENLKNEVAQYAYTIKTLETAIGGNKKFSYAEITSDDFKNKIVEFKNINDNIALYRKNIAEKVDVTSNNDILEATLKERRALVLSFEKSAQKEYDTNNNKSKEKNTIAFEAIALANKYNDEKAKLVQLNQSDLSFFIEKMKAEQESYDKAQSNTSGTLKSRYAISDLTEKNLKEELALTESKIKALDVEYKGQEIAKEKNDEYKNLVEKQKYLDTILGDQAEWENKKNQYAKEYLDLIKQAQDSLYQMKESHLELVGSELKLKELVQDRVSLGQTENDRYKNEIKLMLERYQLEMAQLDLKEDRIRANMALSQAENKDTSSYIGQQTTAVNSYVGTKLFANGGYTGDGEKYDVAGIVHKSE